MKKPTALKILITTGFLSFLLFSVGSLRCESPPGGSSILPPQANSSGTALGKSGDQSWLEDQEDKHGRFKELEWLIKQSLLMKYQRMEIEEDLEDLPD
jgi:hypothetical protein